MNRISKNLLYLALFLTVPTYAGGMLSDKWERSVFINTDMAQVQTSTGENALSVEMLSDSSLAENKERKRICSWSQKIPEDCDQNSTLVLSFEARCLKQQPGYLIAAISSSPGNNPPGTHAVAELTNEWKAYTFSLPLPGIKPDSVFEFIWEGVMKKGDKLEIRNISLDEDEGKSSPRMYITSPCNLLLAPEENVVSGKILPLRSHDGGTGRIILADESEPEKPVAETTVSLVRPETPFRLTVDSLPESNYILTAVLSGKDGQNPRILKKNIWKSSVETLGSSVQNNRLFRNGKPFTVIGIYHAGMWNVDRANEISVQIGSPVMSYDEAYAGLAERGFNTIHSVTKPDGSDIGDLASIAEKYGLQVMPELRIPKQQNFAVPENLIGWYGKDEASSGAAHEEGRILYAELKAIKPHSAVFAANYSTDISKVIAADGCFIDCILFDHYVIREKNTDFTQLSNELAALGQDIKKNPSILFGYVPQCFVYNGPEPTYEQVRLQVYLGIIHGARAFMYYAFNEDYDHRTDFTARQDQFPEIPDGMSGNSKRRNWFLPESIIWDRIGELNAEILELSPFILNDGIPVNVISLSGDIAFAAKSIDGKTYFIAANLKNAAMDAGFEFTKADSFLGLFGTENVKILPGLNTLSFQPYEVKVLVQE